MVYVLWIILFVPKPVCVPGNWYHNGFMVPILSDCIESASLYVGASSWEGPLAYDEGRYDLYISSMAIPQPRPAKREGL